ncbi:hypothetical protein JZ751_003940 [Albula glossodonta]|uniref:Uncharacterized protein n=1 Tax=Albula glossodonta TaxID=121402 RepID=A0A8T2P3B0_9TELE|nr:hypothetical protein JZ751_003940 [Albula glossodonta]
MVQQPTLAADFTKEDSIFGSCYSKELGRCDLNDEEEKGHKNRSKNDDTFSSSSAPISFNEVKAQRPLRSTPANSEETCIKMEVKVKALVHSSSPSPALNGVRKEFHDLQMEGLFQDPSQSLKSSEPQNVSINGTFQAFVALMLKLQSG